MEANLLEESLKKDGRFKNLEKRSKIFWKRVDQGTKNKKALLKRMKSIGKQVLATLPELDDLSKIDFDIEISLLLDHYESLKEGISIKLNKVDRVLEGSDNDSNQLTGTKELDEIAASTAIDKYISSQESLITRREELMAKAEAAQVRIKELLDSLAIA